MTACRSGTLPLERQRCFAIARSNSPRSGGLGVVAFPLGSGLELGKLLSRLWKENEAELSVFLFGSSSCLCLSSKLCSLRENKSSPAHLSASRPLQRDIVSWPWSSSVVRVPAACRISSCKSRCSSAGVFLPRWCYRAKDAWPSAQLSVPSFLRFHMLLLSSDGICSLFHKCSPCNS